MFNPHYWIFLIILGFLAAMIGFGIDETVEIFTKLNKTVTSEETMPYMAGYALWIAFTFFFVMVAASIGEFISKDAEGSGIPELKSILAGVNIYRYLSF